MSFEEQLPAPDFEQQAPEAFYDYYQQLLQREDEQYKQLLDTQRHHPLDLEARLSINSLRTHLRYPLTWQYVQIERDRAQSALEAGAQRVQEDFPEMMCNVEETHFGLTPDLRIVSLLNVYGAHSDGDSRPKPVALVRVRSIDHVGEKRPAYEVISTNASTAPATGAIGHSFKTTGGTLSYGPHFGEWWRYDLDRVREQRNTQSASAALWLGELVWREMDGVVPPLPLREVVARLDQSLVLPLDFITLVRPDVAAS